MKLATRSVVPEPQIDLHAVVCIGFGQYGSGDVLLVQNMQAIMISRRNHDDRHPNNREPNRGLQLTEHSATRLPGGNSEACVA